jgi:glycosyltransferase involved in cell wall biosynthesis
LLRELPYAQCRDRQRILKQGRKKEAEERALVKLCDVITAVSEVDAEYYRELADDKSKIHVFSNVIDLESYTEIPDAASQIRHPSIYLAGTFWPSSPMENAARWTIDEILPLVKKSIPEVQFVVVGKGSDQILADIEDPSIVITGKLPSVLAYLCHADVALVPLKFESGTRFKILEAGACKIPVVSTTLGAEGIPVKTDENILIADDAAKFAEAIVRLIKDREFAGDIASNCHSLVKEFFSVDYLVEEARQIIGYLNHD